MKQKNMLNYAFVLKQQLIAFKIKNYSFLSYATISQKSEVRIEMNQKRAKLCICNDRYNTIGSNFKTHCAIN